MGTRSHDNLLIRSPKFNQLNILSLLASDPHLTQAELADRCSLSVAMVNNYMKELCSMGFLEYRRKSVKSVSYHLTLLGQEQVKMLKLDLLEEMVSLFAEAKEQIRERIFRYAPGMLHQVVLLGSGNLAEMAFHALELAGVNILGVCDDDPNKAGRECCGRELLSPSQIHYMAPDAVIIADPHRTEAIAHSLDDLQSRGIQLIYLIGKNGEKINHARTTEQMHLLPAAHTS